MKKELTQKLHKDYEKAIEVFYYLVNENLITDALCDSMINKIEKLEQTIEFYGEKVDCSKKLVY